MTWTNTFTRSRTWGRREARGIRFIFRLIVRLWQPCADRSEVKVAGSHDGGDTRDDWDVDRLQICVFCDKQIYCICLDIVYNSDCGRMLTIMYETLLSQNLIKKTLIKKIDWGFKFYWIYSILISNYYYYLLCHHYPIIIPIIIISSHYKMNSITSLSSWFEKWNY